MEIKLRTTHTNIIDTGEFFNPSLEIKMTSRDIADLTGKRHADIIRDIKTEISNLGDEIGERIFALTSYVDKSNRQSPQYIFGKKGVMQLALKYDAKTRHKVVDRLDNLERGYFDGVTRSMLLLEKKIEANGSNWGRMGNDQREAWKDYKHIEDEVKKMIQPDLPLEDF